MYVQSPPELKAFLMTASYFLGQKQNKFPYDFNDKIHRFCPQTQEYNIFANSPDTFTMLDNNHNSFSSSMTKTSMRKYKYMNF